VGWPHGKWSDLDLGILSILLFFFKVLCGLVPVAHAYNHSYSGGRNQEDHGSKPAWADCSQDLISKIPNTNRAGGIAQGVGPEFKPWYCKKKKKKVLCVCT
jgi:hypothetical protein